MKAVFEEPRWERMDLDCEDVVCTSPTDIEQTTSGGTEGVDVPLP